MKNLPFSFFIDLPMLLIWTVIAIIRANAGGERYLVAMIFWAVFIILIRFDLLCKDLRDN